MGFKSEALTFFFGMLLILVTFGDSRFHIATTGSSIGNLDSIFGTRLWPVLDVILPLASILVFLLYGWSKQGKIKINLGTVLLFLSYLAALTLIIVDDITGVVGINVQFSQLYWNIITPAYPIYSTFAFFMFGRENGKK